MNFLSEYKRKTHKGRLCFWKAFGALGILFGLSMAIVSVMLKKKNDEYLEALIDLSDNFCEDDISDKDAWQSSHSPSRRKTVEERLSEQRIIEE